MHCVTLCAHICARVCMRLHLECGHVSRYACVYYCALELSVVCCLYVRYQYTCVCVVLARRCVTMCHDVSRWVTKLRRALIGWEVCMCMDKSLRGHHRAGDSALPWSTCSTGGDILNTTVGQGNVCVIGTVYVRLLGG